MQLLQATMAQSLQAAMTHPFAEWWQRAANRVQWRAAGVLWRLRHETAVMWYTGASGRVTAFQQARGKLLAWAHIMSITEAPSYKGVGNSVRYVMPN